MLTSAQAQSWGPALKGLGVRMPDIHTLAWPSVLTLRLSPHLQRGYYTRQTYSRFSGNNNINLKILQNPQKESKISSKELAGRFVGRNSQLCSFTKAHFSDMVRILLVKRQEKVPTSSRESPSTTIEGLEGQAWARLAHTRCSHLSEEFKMSPMATGKSKEIQATPPTLRKSPKAVRTPPAHSPSAEEMLCKNILTRWQWRVGGALARPGHVNLQSQCSARRLR